MPLGVIIIITSVKDLYEDNKRATADATDNDQSVVVVCEQTSSVSEITVKASKIHAGMVLKISKNDYVPVDGLLVYSPSPSIYVDTANIDGETVLKKKEVLSSLQRAF